MIIEHQTSHLRWRGLGALALIAGLIIAAPLCAGFAQSAARLVGTLDAEAQAPVPKGAAMRVQASSGAPEARAIADLFRQALKESGHRPAPSDGSGGGYVLSFRVSGDSPDAGGRSALELRGNRGSSSSGDVELKMRWKLKRGDAAPVRRARRLSVSIMDADRNQVWRARIEMQPNDADDLAMVDAVMPALMANLGRTVYALRVP